jgi:predicted transposase YbfD/YdcC
MSRNQFFFTEKSPIPGKEGEFTSFRASFNINKVIRSLTLDDGRVLVLLDDIHQRPQMVEVKNKQGKVTAIKKEMNTFQSEIYLTEKDDIERFYNWTSIDQ